MGRATDHRLVADDAPSYRNRQVVLTQVQDRSPDGQRHIGAVVRREQGAVPLGGRREDLEEPDLIPGLEAFFRSWTMSTPPERTASRKSARSPWRDRESVHR